MFFSLLTVSEPWESKLLLLSPEFHPQHLHSHLHQNTGITPLSAGHPSNTNFITDYRLASREVASRISSGRLSGMSPNTLTFVIRMRSPWSFPLSSRWALLNVTAMSKVSTFNKYKVDIVAVIPHHTIPKTLGCLAQRFCNMKPRGL